MSGEVQSFEYLNQSKKKPDDKPKKKNNNPKKKNDKKIVKQKEVVVIKTIEELGYEFMYLRRNIRLIVIISIITLFLVGVISLTGYYAFVKLGWLKI